MRQIIHPIVLQLTRFRVSHRIVVQGACRSQTVTPAIFAVNHTNSYDIPIACRAIKKHCWVLIGKQRLYLSDRLFFFLNGAIWVDRKDKTDMLRSKEQVQKHLCSGKSLIWFPEGTWNLTDNLPMLPMKWGIIECAQKCHVPIYPVVLEYGSENKQCIIRIGTPFFPDNMTLLDGITALRDKMAEMRWILWEQSGILSRKYIDPQKEQSKIYQAVADYPPLDLDYEKSVVFQLTKQ